MYARQVFSRLSHILVISPEPNSLVADLACDLGSSYWDTRQSPLTGTKVELRKSNTGHLERDLLEKRAEPPVLVLCEPPLSPE